MDTSDGKSITDGPSSDPTDRALFRSVTSYLDSLIRVVELVAAFVFAVLFAIGVVDLSLQIVAAARSGSITDPLIVVGFIDTGLLLLIVVEVYQTVIAYTREMETRAIVQLVLYTGIIAMVRKIIIFRTSEYPTTMDALFAATAYFLIIAALAVFLYAERRS